MHYNDKEFRTQRITSYCKVFLHCPCNFGGISLIMILEQGYIIFNFKRKIKLIKNLLFQTFLGFDESKPPYFLEDHFL